MKGQLEEERAEIQNEEENEQYALENLQCRYRQKTRRRTNNML
jgi:hypothetical protein